MSVLSMPPSRSLPETRLEDISHLAVTLSAQLARVQVDDLGPAIGDALDCVAAATRIEDCRFVEFNEAGAVRRTHVASRREGRWRSVPGPGH